MQLVDATGTPLQLSDAPSRVVSLVPSLTEAVFAFGAGSRLAGITRYCVEPAAEVSALTVVGGTKDPDLRAILALQPDLVLASAEENRREDVDVLRAAGCDVFVTLYETVAAAVDGLAEVAALLGLEREPAWLGEARGAVVHAQHRRELAVPYFCPIWRRPYMVARDDTYMADLMRLAGGVNAVALHGPSHYASVELESLPLADPQVVLLPDEPYPFSARHIEDFARFAEISAVKNGQIHLVDGKALTWYGPRIADALRTFTHLLNGARAVAQPLIDG